MTQHHVAIYQSHNLGAVVTQVIHLLVLEFRLNLLEVVCKVIIVSLLLCSLLQKLQRQTCLRLIGNIFVGHKLHKILIVGIGNRKLAILDLERGVATNVLVQKVLYVAQIVEHNSEARDIVGLNLDVGHQTLTIIDLTTCRRAELVDERVGHILVLTARVRVVDTLHAAARGDIIFCCGNLRVGVIPYRHHSLHQALTIRALAHKHRAVHILQRTADNLRRRRRITIYQRHQRHITQHGIRLGSIGACCIARAALHRKHLRALGNKHRENLHRLGNATTAIVAVVENQTLQFARRAQALNLGAHIIVAAIGKVVVADIADTIGHKARIRHAGDRDTRTLNLQLLHFARHNALNGQFNLRAGCALQARRYLLGVKLGNVLAIDFDELIANLQARQVGRRAFIGLCDNHATAITLHTNRRADTAILTRSLNLKFVHLLLGHKDRIGVEVAHHTGGAITHKFVGVHLIDILQRQLAHKVDHNLHITAQTEIIARSPHARRDSRHEKRHKAISLYSLHFKKLFHTVNHLRNTATDTCDIYPLTILLDSNLVLEQHNQAAKDIISLEDHTALVLLLKREARSGKDAQEVVVLLLHIALHTASDKAHTGIQRREYHNGQAQHLTACSGESSHNVVPHAIIHTLGGHNAQPHDTQIQNAKGCKIFRRTN